MIETKRLVLRPWRVEDTEDAFEIYGNYNVTRWLAGKPEESLETQRAWLERVIGLYEPIYPTGLGFWAAELKETGRVVGAGMLKDIRLSEGEEPSPLGDYEIGWHLAESHWGQGLGTEIGRACLDQALELGLVRVVAVAYPDNDRSLKIMDKLGLRAVGMSKRYFDLELMLYEKMLTYDPSSGLSDR